MQISKSLINPFKIFSKILKMNIFAVAIFIAGFIYSTLYDLQFLYLYFFVVGVYTIINMLIPSGKFNGVRRKIQIASWGGI